MGTKKSFRPMPHHLLTTLLSLKWTSLSNITLLLTGKKRSNF